MTGEITLTPGATAEPDTCGSCKYFRRKTDGGEWYGMNGFCCIKLPNKYVSQTQYRDIDDRLTKRERDYTGNEDMIKDTDRCDLQRPDGKVYIVQRRITP